MKRIPSPPVPALTAAAPASPAAVLTADQLRVAHLFAAMDDRRQQEAMVRMARIAATHPRRAAPALRLIAGGAK